MLFVNILLLLIGFVLLIKGADFFVEGASGIANRFGISQIVIGLTVVAIGTSAPEAAVSITAAIKGTTDMAIGNVLGSNILNILLILGATACLTPLAVQKNTLRYEIPFVIVITAIILAAGAIFGYLGRIVGIVLVLLLMLFFVYLIKISKKAENAAEETEVDEVKRWRPMWKLILFTVIGVGAIVLGSDLAIDGATYIAGQLGMSDRIIGLTIVALGTSLPELVTSLVAARKGNTDIAVGNIVGSCIFNILFVLGTTAIITPIPFAKNLIIDGLIAFGAAVLLLVSVVLNKKRKLGRLGGALMLASFVGYYVYLFLTM